MLLITFHASSVCVCCDGIKSVKSAEARYEIFVISLAAKITEEGRQRSCCCGCKV